MAIDLATYAASRKYTEQTCDGLGYLKGAPATIKSIVHQNGLHTITFEWTSNSGAKETKDVVISDGTPIYVWESGNTYKYGDLVIYESKFYRCIVEHTSLEFSDTYFNEIGSADGNYDIIQDSSQLPLRFTAADRKMYYSIADSNFFLWNGESWVLQEPKTISEEQIKALFN